jgi:hypothetical protein
LHAPALLPWCACRTQVAGDWNVYSDAKYGTGVLTVHNETTLQWRYIHSTDMAVADEFYITNTH